VIARLGVPALLVLLAGCAPTTEGMAPGECSDGEDNDGDGLTDCEDSHCDGAPACEDPELDDDGCLVAGTFGAGGEEGLQWLAVDGYGDGSGPEWTIAAWGPPDLDPAEPLPLAMFVTRNLPPDRADLLDILEGFIGMDTMVADTGMIGAVMLPGITNAMNGDVIGWSINNGEDEDYFVDALAKLEATFNVNRARIHLFGSHASGGYATHFAYNHADRIASTANQAGYNPFNPWPSSWLRPVSGMFIHDPNDEVQPESEIEDSALMFEAAGATVERFYDLDSPAMDGHHDWDSEDIWPRLNDFQFSQCVEESRL